MPTDDSTLLNSLVAALADDRGVDWDAAEQAGAEGTNQDLVRQFRIISAMGAERRDAATASSWPWPRGMAAAWTAVVAIAGAKVAVAIGGIGVLFAPAAPAARWPFAITLALFGLSGMLLVAGGGNDPRVRSLGALYLIIASAFANPLMPHVDAAAVDAAIAVLHRLPVDAFLPLALWLFVRGFPSEPAHRLARRVADGFVALSAGVGTLLFAANAWPAGGAAGVRAGPFAATLKMLDRDAATLAYWPLLFAVAAVALPYLVWKLRFETVEEKQRGALFITALVAGIMPMIVAVIATPFVPALRDPSRRAVIGWVLYVALISIVPSTAYAVGVQRVMDVQLIVRKTLQHALARYAVWLASIGPLTYLLFNMYMPGIIGPEFDVRRQPPALFALPLVGFAVLIFRERLLRAVDRWFLRGAVDYAEALARVDHGFRKARSVREIARLLAREIGRAIHPTTIVVFVVEDGREQLAALEGTCAPLGTRSVLVELLHLVRSDIQLDPQADGPIARLLPPEDRDWLVAGQFTLICPLIDSTGRLLAMIAMGESRGGLPYTKQDRMFITAISSHAAMQLENRWLQEFTEGDPAGTQPRGVVAIDWDKEPGAQCPNCSVLWPGNVRICSCRTPTVAAALPIVVNTKFRVERLLGAGGMGVVYLAVDVTLDRKVAIKTLPNMTPDRAAWLQREARTMASVLHPNLALIFGAEQWRGTPLLIVEYLEGGTLSDYLRRGALEADEVIDLGIVLADVLDRVHGSGILHRDIKPSNIAYTRDGTPKLLDFGVAAMLDRSMGDDERLPLPTGAATFIPDIIERSQPLQTFASSTWRLVGTPLYLSPEAVAGQVPQPSFDLWSLSLVLYETLTGRHPFSGESVAQVIANIEEARVPDVRDFRPDCPAELAALLRDSLSPVLVRRPATANELRIRLQRLRASRHGATG